MRFDQRLTELHLHAGSVYPGGSGWLFGDRIATSEIHRIVAGFNGGFKFNVPGNGFMEGGRTAVPLKSGLGSVVTYSDGTTAIGAWGAGVPAPGLSVGLGAPEPVSARRPGPVGEHGHQLSALLLGLNPRAGAQHRPLRPGDHGRRRPRVGRRRAAHPGLARAGADRRLAVRAVQLDINGFWVAGYLYAHRPSGPVATPVVPGQDGIAGQLRLPYSRDFFTVVAR